MRILLLSRDQSSLKEGSTTLERWRLLRDQNLELRAVVAGRIAYRHEEKGISIESPGGGSALVRLFRCFGIARKADADMICAQDPFELGLIAWLVARQKKIKFELQDHGGFFDGEPADEPLWFWRSKLAWWLARRADSIRTVSPKSLENLKARGLGKKSYWLPIPADLRFAALARSPESGLVVSVGRLVSVKRFSLLLESLAELRRDVPHAGLAIIGDGPMRQALERRAEELGIKPAVEFVGQADPAPWLERAAVFALLSSHEGWGIAAVEAALAGIPVVMSDTGCARWLEERGASTVIRRDAETPKDIALRLSAAMTHGLSKASASIQSLDGRQSAVEQVKAWSRML